MLYHSNLMWGGCLNRNRQKGGTRPFQTISINYQFSFVSSRLFAFSLLFWNNIFILWLRARQQRRWKTGILPNRYLRVSLSRNHCSPIKTASGFMAQWFRSNCATLTEIHTLHAPPTASCPYVSSFSPNWTGRQHRYRSIHRLIKKSVKFYDNFTILSNASPCARQEVFLSGAK